MSNIPTPIRKGIRSKIAHLQVLAEELDLNYDKPRTAMTHAQAAGILQRLGIKAKEILDLGMIIQDIGTAKKLKGPGD